MSIRSLLKFIHEILDILHKFIESLEQYLWPPNEQE